MTPIPGNMLSHYLLVERIGAGGMGVVFRAHDTRLQRDVAIKVLSPQLTAEPELRRRFLREARAAAALTHSNIAAIHEIDEANGITFIVMELVEGRSLRALVRDGPLPIDDALRIATELADGLARAHRGRIVHRDLKPDNVIIAADRHVKILDFGLAKLLEDREASQWAALSRAPGEGEPLPGGALSQEPTATGEVTREGQLIGTPHYMSPEQARGLPADQRSDIFAFGVTLYEMLTGRRPFTGRNPVETLAAILHTPPPPAATFNSAIPPRLGEILARCLEKDAGRRYRDGAELAGELRELQDLILTPVSVTAKPAPPRRGRAAMIGIGAVVVAAIAIGVLVWRGRVQPPGSPAAAGIAILPLAYTGPEEKAHLQSVIPILWSERMRQAQGLRVAPFEFSRGYPPGGDAAVVARELGVDRVVEGRLAIAGDRFELTIRIVDPDEDAGDGPGGAGAPAGMASGGLASLYEEAGRLALDAVTTFGAGPLSAPAGRSPVNMEAMELYLQGTLQIEGWDVQENYARAAELAQEAIDLDPGFAAAHALLSRALITEYVQTKDPALIPRALQAAQRAVALAPSLPEGHAALGRVEVWQGRSAEAARSFEAGLRLAPADDALIRSFARAYARLGRDAEAEEMFRRAIDLRPTYWAHHNGLGVFYFRLGRLEDAKRQFRRVIELRPGSDTGYSNLAAVHILAGEHAEAEPLLRAALNIDPADNTRNNLGVVYYATDRFEEAAREWQAIVDGGAEQVMYLANLGDAYRQLGRGEEAGRAYGRAVELGERQLEVGAGDSEARAMYAIALAGSGRCDEANHHAERARREAPGNPTLCYYGAVSAAICGARDAAVARTKCAIEGGIKVDVMTNPDLEPLLGEPALRALLEQPASSVH